MKPIDGAEAPWTVRRDGEHGRERMTRAQAERVARVLNALQRTRFGRRLWYAAPEGR